MKHLFTCDSLSCPQLSSLQVCIFRKVPFNVGILHLGLEYCRDYRRDRSVKQSKLYHSRLNTQDILRPCARIIIQLTAAILVNKDELVVFAVCQVQECLTANGVTLAGIVVVMRHGQVFKRRGLAVPNTLACLQLVQKKNIGCLQPAVVASVSDSKCPGYAAHTTTPARATKMPNTARRPGR